MNKVPFVTKEQLDEITRTYPTPFHLYDEKGIRKNVKALKEAFSWNPGYKEYFAVKATPNPFLIQIWLRLRLLFLYRADALRRNRCKRGGHYVFLQ